MGILHCIGMGVDVVVLGQSQMQISGAAALSNFALLSAQKDNHFPPFYTVKPRLSPLPMLMPMRFAINLTASRRPRGTRAKTTHYPALTERII